MTGLFEVALKNVPALQDSVNQHEMASAGMLGEEAQAESFPSGELPKRRASQAESLQDNLRRMDAGSNAQAVMVQMGRRKRRHSCAGGDGTWRSCAGVDGTWHSGAHSCAGIFAQGERAGGEAVTGLGIRDLAWDSAFMRRQLCARRTDRW